MTVEGNIYLENVQMNIRFHIVHYNDTYILKWLDFFISKR